MNRKIIQIFTFTRSWLLTLMCVTSFFATSLQSNAQVASYTFSQTTTSYTAITGGTLLSGVGVSNDDNTYGAVPIGFSFNYNGTLYTTIGVNSNGYFQFGGTAPGSFYDGTSIQNVTNSCHPFSEDLMGGAAGCEIEYLTTGSVGSRIFTIQWKNWGFYNGGVTTGPEINFQAQLFEGSNIVQFNYSPGTISSTQTCQAGLTGAATSDFKSRTGTTAWASAIASVVNTAQLSWNTTGSSPVSGLSYIWNPPPPCVAPTAQPTAYVPGVVTATTIAGSFTPAVPAPSGYLVVRYLTGAAVTNPVTGTSYIAGNSLGLGTVVQSSALTTFNATGLVPSTTYDFYIYSMNNTACLGTAYLLVSPLTTTQTSGPPVAYTSTALGGLWNNTATWVGGVVPPASNDVIIAAGAIVTYDLATTTYNNITVNGRLQYNATANTITTLGNFLISGTGSFIAHTSGGVAPGTITIGGNFTNNGFADLALATFVFSKLSGAVTFDGTGTFVLDQSGRGLINSLLFTGLGSFTVNTSQNMVVRSAMANLGSFNPNAKMSIDVTAVVYAQAYNTSIANVAVTAMGSLYGVSAPVTTAAGATRWIAATAVALGNLRFTAGNLYVCTTAGTTSATPPSHTSGIAVDNTAQWLWVSSAGTVGNAFVPTTVPTVGTIYFYGANLYLCTVAGAQSAVAPPTCSGAGVTCASGLATYRWIGTPASFSVNYDATTQTVRSLNIVSAGSGYPAAPTVTFASTTATGSGAAATAPVIALIGNAASAVFNQQISTGATFTTPFTTINNGQSVTSISVATGGVNYTVAPAVGIGFPTSQNLVTAGGSGYTTAPTVSVSGGTTVTGFVNPTFTVTVNQGKVVSVYCATGGSGYLTAPTLTLVGGGGSGATCAFIAGTQATATPVIGSNGQILSFTITNAGSGYVASPTCLLAGGTFTTTATTAPIARIGLYGINFAFFAPSPAAGTINAGNAIPADRKLNNMTINNTRVNAGGNLILTGTAPTTWTSGLLDMGGNNLSYTWNGYAGATLAGTAFGVRNGSITLVGRGGGTTGSTWAFPFIGNSFVAATGTGADGLSGSDILNMTVTETAAPSGGVPGNAPIGSRAWRVQTSPGTTYGTGPTVTLRWNSNDSIDGTAFPSLSNQGDLYVGEATSLASATWTLRSSSYGASGLIPVLATLTTSGTAPGPIANTTNKFYAYINTQVAPTMTSFSPANICTDAGILVINGTGFKGITAANVTIGGTPVTAIASYTTTQIIARVSAASSGIVSVTTSGGTCTSSLLLPSTCNAVASGVTLVTPTRVPTNGLICAAGGSVALDATQATALSYSWVGSGLSSSVIANPSASPSVTTQYIVNIDMTVCTASYTVNVGVLPPFAFTPTSAVDSICFAAPSITVNMNANLSSSGFGVTSVPYAPAAVPLAGATTLATGGVAAVPLSGGSLDDGGWGGIPIGFSYNFFGTNFNTLAVGTNGLVMFGTVPGYTTAAGDLGQFSFAGPPVFPNASNPGNVIGLMLSDMLFTNIFSNLKYWTDGIAPTRRFVLSGNYAQFSGGALTTVQLFLYETTGLVEIHIGSSAATIGRTVGLQDVTRTIGAAAPGWTSRTTTLSTPEAWRFIPPASYTFNWSTSGGSLSSTSIANPVVTVASAPVSNYDNYVLTVTAANPTTTCSSTQVDSFKVFNTPGSVTVTNAIECSNPAVATCSVATTTPGFATHTYRWYSAPTGGTLLQSGPHTTYDSLLTQTTTFYVSEVNGLCESARVAVTDSVPALFSVSNTPVAICTVGDSITFTATPNMGGATFSWSGGPFATLSSTSIAAYPATTTTYTVTETSGACVQVKQISASVYTPIVFVPSSSVDSICYSAPSVTVNMNANLSGTTFAISAEPYVPYVAPGGGITTLCTGGAFVTPQRSAFPSLDDGGWRIGMPFFFNFLGLSTDSINIGTNGVVQFGAFSDADLSDFTYVSLPSTTEPKNIIAGCATDLYWATAGTIRTWTTGIAPNRKFVISYEGGAGFTTDGSHTFQIVLSETVGTAEVIVTAATSTAHNKTIGCNNSTGLIGSTAPGRNGTLSTFGPEAWLFTPPASYTFAWTGTGLSSTTIVNPNATISSIPVGLFDAYGYSVIATNTLTGCTAEAVDSFKVFRASSAATSVTASIDTICAGSNTTLSQSGGYVGNGVWRWYTNPSYTLFAGTGTGPSGTLVVAPLANTTYYARAENIAPCPSNVGDNTVSVTVYVNNPSIAAPSVSATPTPICSGDTVTLTQSGGTLGTNAVWRWYSSNTFSPASLIGTGAGASAFLRYSQLNTSTYFVRAEGNASPCPLNVSNIAIHATVIVNAPGVGGCVAPPRHNSICYPSNVTARITTASPYTSSGYANINTHSDTAYDNTALATFQVGTEPIGSCGGAGITNKTLWYKFTAPFCATPTVHISTDDRSTTNFNTRLSVYRRAGITCSSPYTEIACNDDATYYLNTGATNSSTVILTPNSATPGPNEYAPGEDLFIQASGTGATYGSYGLIIDLEPLVPTASSVGSGSAVINWNAAMTSPWGGVLGTYIQWRVVGSGPTVAGTYRYVAGPLGTTTLTGLLPGTAYEYWASYVCGNGGRWWSKKGTFTTSATCTGGTSPNIVSIVAGTPCNQPVITFNATSLAYSSYRVVRKDTFSSTVLVSGAYYTSPSAQTYTSAPLTLGRTYQFYVLAYCGTNRVDSSAMVTFTTCASLRMANPNATHEAAAQDKDVAYILPNGDVVYGVPFNAIDLPIDVNNPNAQEITIKTIDAASYFNNTTKEELVIATDGDMMIFPNPANSEATLSYNLTNESVSMSIQILDAQGKVLLSDQVSNPGVSGDYTINLNKFSAGVYFVKVVAGDYIQTRKLIVETR